MDLYLQNNVVIVTGGGSGIGAAISQLLAEEGAIPVLVTNAAPDAAFLAGLQRLQPKTEVIFTELCEEASCRQAVDQTLAQFGRIDGLVNNGALATGLGGKPFETIQVEEWDRVMRVNTRSIWLAIKACAPYLRKSAAGKVVNISSDTALFGSDRILHYVASKGAVISMTRSLARELGPDNIAVNAIAPGLVAVEATEYVPQDRKDLYVSGRAMQRTQLPEDVTGVVVFLLGQGAGFVTGQLLPVNGGFVLN